MEKGPLRGRRGRQERREQKPGQINDPSSSGGGISSRKVGGCLAVGQFAKPSIPLSSLHSYNDPKKCALLSTV